MSDLHIDDFYRDCAKTLVFLYGHFPVKTTVFVEDISGPDTPDEFGLHSPRHQACFNALLWLAQTGYLQFDQTIRQEAIDQVVLSHKGFLALSGPSTEVLPSAEQNLEIDAQNQDGTSPLSTYVQALRNELKSGTSISLADLMQSLMRCFALQA